MIGKALILATCFAFFTSALYFGSAYWDGLVVTFGVGPSDSSILNEMPRTIVAAENQGWLRINDCDIHAKFQGIRYMKNSDPAVILLFDVEGYIAGIQCGIRASPVYPPLKQQGQIFQQDEELFVLTAYFTDPAIICTTGRSASQFKNEGTGSSLYLQNGSEPVTDSVRIPKYQVDVDHDDSSWTEGHCFIFRMGVHYWYNVSEAMRCDDFQPVFLLYNSGRLNAFGWALGTNEASSRFEHPAHNTISMFMNPVPRCLQDYSTLSTMHIYLTAYPLLNTC